MCKGVWPALCPCITCVQNLRKSEEGVICPVTGVTDNCELPAWMLAHSTYFPVNIIHLENWKLITWVCTSYQPFKDTQSLRKNDSCVNYCGHAIFICLLGKNNEPNNNDLFSQVEVTEISFWLVLTSKSRLTSLSETKAPLLLPRFHWPNKVS